MCRLRVDKCKPFDDFGSASFRAMFEPFHPDAKTIVKSANRASIRESVYRLGLMTKQATEIEMKKHRGSWTSDHWTGHDDVNYTTTTYHYIEDWVLKSLIVDFQAHDGPTKGVDIFETQKKVLEKVGDKSRVVIGITDTTSNMNSLGKELREDGYDHAYCSDHSFNLNAKLAFNGEHQHKCTSHLFLIH